MHVYFIKPDYKNLDLNVSEILEAVSGMNPGYTAFHMPVLSAAYYHHGQALADQGRFAECRKINEESDKLEHEATGIISHAICIYVTGRFHSLLIMGELTELHKMFKHFIDVYHHIMQGFPSIVVFPAMALLTAIQEENFQQTNHIDTAFDIFNNIMYLNALVLNPSLSLIDACLTAAKKPGGQKYLRYAEIMLGKLQNYCERGEALGYKARYFKLQARFDMLTQENLDHKKIKHYFDEALAITENIGMRAETAFLHAEYALYFKSYTQDKISAEQHYKKAQEIFKDIKIKFWDKWYEELYSK